MQSWLEGRNWIGKGAQATGTTTSLRILSSKADSNTWESFIRSELKLEWVHQESPHSDIFRKKAIKPLLKQKHRQKHLTRAKEKKNWTVAQWSKVLFSNESKFCISFGNQGPRVWRKSGKTQNPCCLKSSVKFSESVMIWAAMPSAGVGPLWHVTFWSPQSTQPLPGNFRALHASFCWQALWRCWFHFTAGLRTCPHCQRYQKLVQWPWCLNSGRNYLVMLTDCCSSCPGGWSQTILEVKMLDVEVLGWCRYKWSAVVRPVGCTAKFSETPLEMAYGK